LTYGALQMLTTYLLIYVDLHNDCMNFVIAVLSDTVAKLNVITDLI